MTPRVIDLTLPIHDGMSTYPAPYHPRVRVRQLGFIDQVGRESRELTLGTHSGTHVDAASHFIPGGRTIDQVDLADLVGSARLIVFPERSPGSGIGAGELRDQLGPGRFHRVVMRTDWSRNWGSDRYYLDYPYLTADACSLLLEIGVRLFASDTPSVDDPRQSGPSCSPDSPNHKVLLKSGVSLVEYLTGLDSLRTRQFTLVAAPLRIQAGDGAPARVFALED